MFLSAKWPALLPVLLLLLSVQPAHAQQPFTYTQYMDNLAPINSTYSLLDKAGAVHALVRKQWVGIDGAPATLIANGYLPLVSFGGAAGLNIMHDEFGPEKMIEASAFLAKSVRLSKTEYLAASMSFGVRRYEARYSNLDPADPLFQDDILETVGTFGLGLMYFIPEKFYMGVSVPRISFRELGRASVENSRYFKNHYYLMAGYLAALGENIKIKPAVLASYASNIPLHADFSMTLYLKETLGLGVNYRTNNEVGTILSVLLNNRLRFGYSYQFGLESYRLGHANDGTHEITLGYRIGSEITGKKLL
ncbi:type IX secretion system PorP/SprF family membrane protein [Anseongella ginsenosidimutans]|uniref:Type IX secretion system PorP/SprF family membrane protein n=1 Tax=Anseongella ginsenosidimutans TaxID=496056 RepID=A0A4R3KLQ8_9SPHI|nr:PorP/SprF family type IX secretion system membrane protein [Anseongella ginsenosidimutans]QEC51898.1 type IX secretion system membrane protein PorP/SprF [Anseongella ginsenosidimutans]TCS85079.1 type IX secretion system PorP/SprF family membrane protein [Anseongella ginsenosidimutans]